MADLALRATTIPGLLVVDLPVHADNRGWFKENWQREKMVAAGLPDFSPVQNNISFNAQAGATRGVHAEPWDKFLSVATGRVFGAWVDLREGPGFGEVVTLEVGPETAVFVPRGVGNAYQTLEDATSYSYLVNDHWTPAARESYTYVNVADPALGISWPIPLEDAELSTADRAHPLLEHVRPASWRRPVILGSGQLATALAAVLPEARTVGRAELDLADPASYDTIRWADHDVIINAAAFTGVDAAETPEGRRAAWEVNAAAVGRLAALAGRHGCTLVHVSSDYVFDGTAPVHTEDEPLSPLGVYGQTKAAGDLLAQTAPRHLVVRTSWVVGEGANFVATMAALAARGVSPSVVADQQGRLTFADDLARGIVHLIRAGAPSGVYNLTSSGPVMSWYDVARSVFAAAGRDPDDVTPVTTADYGAGRELAPRPVHSTLDLTRIEATGFVPSDGPTALAGHLARPTDDSDPG